MGHIFLPSNALLGTKVTQVSANDNEKDEILYEIGSDAEGKFSIDRTTGWITSNETIDREVWYHKLITLLGYLHWIFSEHVLCTLSSATNKKIWNLASLMEHVKGKQQGGEGV